MDRRRTEGSPTKVQSKKAVIGNVKELGHVVLYVGNLERSRHFYHDILGFKEVATVGDMFAVFSSGRTHHELLLQHHYPKHQVHNPLHPSKCKLQRHQIP
ncbi:MAG: VOC family protein [Thaumarchaeota archaeon]|nr:VOC family protein [Nitrososphaerota archaeon]